MIFQQKFTTNWHDTDANRRVRPTRLLVFMQETSNDHLRYLGQDLDELRDKHGLAFLLSKTRLAIYESLYAREEITVETWTCESRGFAFSRFYRIKRGDTVIAAADTTWALISLETKQLCKADEYDFHFEHEQPIDIGIPSRFRIGKDEKLNLLGERKIVYSDLDYNMHMNNTKYADMLCDFMAYEDIPNIKGISMSYLHEAAFGDTVRIFCSQSEGKYDFKTVNAYGTTCLEAEILV